MFCNLFNRIKPQILYCAVFFFFEIRFFICEIVYLVITNVVTFQPIEKLFSIKTLLQLQDNTTVAHAKVVNDGRGVNINIKYKIMFNISIFMPNFHIREVV